VDWVGCLDDSVCYYNDHLKRFAQTVGSSVTKPAFVTEFAGPTELILAEEDRNVQMPNFDRLRTLTNPFDFLSEMIAVGIPETTVVQSIVDDHIPNTFKVSFPFRCSKMLSVYVVSSVVGCINLFDPPPTWTFDPVALERDLHERFWIPYKISKNWLSRYPYATRMLYALQQPDNNYNKYDDETVVGTRTDPFFSFRSDAPDIDNVHRATATPFCTRFRPQEARELAIITGMRTSENITTTTVGAIPGCPTWEKTGAIVLGDKGFSPALRFTIWGDNIDVNPVDVVATEDPENPGSFDDEAIRELLRYGDSLLLSNEKIPEEVRAVLEDGVGGSSGASSKGRIPIFFFVLLSLLIILAY